MSRSMNEMKIREALRLKEAGLSHSQIASSGTVGVARSTLIELFKRCNGISMNYERAKDLSDSELEALLYPRKFAATKQRVPLNEEAWLLRTKTSGLDRQSVWEEYIREHPGGLSYAHFCRRLRDHDARKHNRLDYPKTRKPGEIMETDWCGTTLRIVFDRDRNALQTVHFFVAALGFSQKYFVYACPDEKQASWIEAHTKALEYYGAVPRIIKPDNTKTAITKPDRYEPQKNPVFALWASYYGVAIVPARVAKPKDKDRAEDVAGTATMKILPKLKNQLFFDFNELNRIIQIEVEKLNKKTYQRRPQSRAEICLDVDLPTMRPLPTHPFYMPEIKWARVSRNGYHVHFDGHQYSAPYQLAGQRVMLAASSTTVELLYDNKRVACHRRCYSMKQIYVTERSHMPEKHQTQDIADAMNGNKYRSWAQSIGPSTKHVIDDLLNRYAVEEQSYQPCMGILRLADRYSPFLLEKACQQAIESGVIGYKYIKHQLEMMASQLDETRTTHANIRGATYYKETQPCPITKP